MCSLLHVAKALHKDKKSVYNSRVQKKKKKKIMYPAPILSIKDVVIKNTTPFILINGI